MTLQPLLLRQWLACRLSDHIRGVPGRPVHIVLAAIALLVLTMGGRGADQRSLEIAR